MKILLVDDDAFLRDMYATKFTEIGHAVEVTENGEQAIGKLQENSYDAVLMDMVMPGMNGIELLKRIKKDKLGGTPACIMLSNQSESPDKEAAIEAGAKGYIVKAEFVPSEVVTEVVNMVSNKTYGEY